MMYYDTMGGRTFDGPDFDSLDLEHIKNLPKQKPDAYTIFAINDDLKDGLKMLNNIEKYVTTYESLYDYEQDAALDQIGELRKMLRKMAYELKKEQLEHEKTKTRQWHNIDDLKDQIITEYNSTQADEIKAYFGKCLIELLYGTQKNKKSEKDKPIDRKPHDILSEIGRMDRDSVKKEANKIIFEKENNTNEQRKYYSDECSDCDDQFYYWKEGWRTVNSSENKQNDGKRKENRRNER